MNIERSNKNFIYQSINRKVATAILGPRRTGKSTLVRAYRKAHPKLLWLNLNLDKMSDRQVVETHQLQEFIEREAKQKLGAGKKIWVSIDEAQKAPALFDQIKLIYDEFKYENIDAVKFILTGSGSLDLHQKCAESLAGRIDLIHLDSFTIRETLGFQEINTSDWPQTLQTITDGNDQNLTSINKDLHYMKTRLCDAIDTHVIWGGLPEVLEITDLNERRNYISQYIQTYLEKDIRSLDTIQDINRFQNLMEILAYQTGSVRNNAKTTEASGLKYETVVKYREIMNATYIYEDIFPLIKSPISRLVKSPKGYLLNNGIVNYLLGTDDLKVLTNTGAIGHRFENWFLSELKTFIGRQNKRSRIHYWRTSSGVEVDFILFQPPNIIPFEVTYSTKIDPKKVYNLKKFLSEHDQAKAGYYVYNGEYQYDAENKIHFLPAWMIG